MLRVLSRCALGAIVLGVGMTAAPARAQGTVCGTAMSTTLVAGQHYASGSITVSNDQFNIYVTYTADAPWLLSEAHAAVAANLAGIPQTRAGNPIPGRFPYSATFDPELSTYTFGIPYQGVFAENQSLVIAAHAVVQAPREQGGSQTAWGQGASFAGSNWAMYLSYTLQPCGGGGGNS